jgi:hypothetical protein
MTAGTKKWKGELGKPIAGHVMAWARIDQNKIEAQRASILEEMGGAIAKARLDKLPLLFEHYGIDDKSDFLSLSLALASEFVPGFSVKLIPMKLEHESYGAVVPVSKTGRLKEWTNDRKSDLLAAVEDVRKSKGLATDREALQLLSRRAPWKRPWNHRGDSKQWIETLEARLQDAKTNRRAFLKFSDIVLKAQEEYKKANSGNSEPV